MIHFLLLLLLGIVVVVIGVLALTFLCVFIGAVVTLTRAARDADDTERRR